MISLFSGGLVSGLRNVGISDYDIVDIRCLWGMVLSRISCLIGVIIVLFVFCSRCVVIMVGRFGVSE